MYEVIINRNNKYKKQHEKDQQTINSLDILYRKSLQDKVIDRIEKKAFVIFLQKMLTKTKMIFLNINVKIKLNFLSNNKFLTKQ